jgi:hypothetical protein
LSVELQKENVDNEELQKFIDREFSYGDCIVAYLDILGFEETVKKYVNSNLPKDKEILGIITSAMAYATKDYNIDEFQNIELIKVKQFSDCTCFCIPDFYGNIIEAVMVSLLITRLKGFNMQFISNNLYLRGGVSPGFHHQNDNIIFSDGLIKAYKLESKKAIYPRIILDRQLIQRFKRLWTNNKEILLDFGIEKVLITDWDGTTFINPFNPIQTMGNNIPDDLIKDISVGEENFESKTAELESIFHNNVMINLQNKIDQYEDNVHVQEKYLWLKELLMWNMDPESSKIKFEYLLK